MQFLVQRVGLKDQFYRGEWQDEQRNGYGIQLFPNGAKFIGNWKDNKANGFGRLEFVNGTYYEGNFKNNKIQEGILYYFSGTYFEGYFDGERDLFRNGKIKFADGEIFQGKWNCDGVLIEGCLNTFDGRNLYFGSTNLIRLGTQLISSVIYEGGFVKGNYDSKGFLYSNHNHPFYFECNYRKRKFHGRFIYHSIFYGFETQEYYHKGQEKGIWKYFTAKGYQYSGDTSSKKQFVKFPFLNKDYFEGDLSIWCDNITFVSGSYTMHQRDLNNQKQIRVINCQDITKNKEIIKNFNTFDETLNLIIKAKYKNKRSNLKEPTGKKLILNDGSYYEGNIINHFVQCHQKDLENLHKKKQQQYISLYDLQSFKNYFVYQAKNDSQKQIQNNFYFQGVLKNGKKEGYCFVIKQDKSQYKGFYNNDMKQGFGQLSIPNKFEYIGLFNNDKMEGKGMMVTKEKNIYKGNFENGFLNGLGFIKYTKNNLEYFGQVFNNFKQGKGILKFSNKYKFEGYFENDTINTNQNKATLICQE